MSRTRLRVNTHLAKWLSVRLRTKCLWIRVQLQSLKFRVKRVRDMTRTYSQMHRTDR